MSELHDVDQEATAADLGDLLHDGDRIGLRFVRSYPHPIGRVWQAITDSDHLRFWLPCDIVGERRAGASITLPFWSGHVEKYEIDEPVLTGEIQVWEPPTRFGWTWDGDVLLWELAEVGDATELTFTTWPADPELAGVVSAAGGYHLCLALLGVLLRDGTAPAMVDIDAVALRLQEAYKQRFGPI